MIDLKPNTKFGALKLHLREKILEEAFKPGERFYSDNTLAAEFGVSHVTAAKVLAALMHEGLIRRVQGLGTFVAERAETPVAPAIGLLTQKRPDEPSGWDRFFLDLAEVLNRHERMLVTLCHQQNEQDAVALRRFLAQKPAGLLIDLEFYKDIAVLRECIGKTPVCVLGERPIGGEVFQAVLLDKKEMYRQMLEMLWARGNRNILFYGFIPELFPAQTEWVDGAIREFTAMHPAACVPYSSERDEGTAYASRLRDIFSGESRPTAVVGMSDYLAYRVVNRLRSLGIQIAWPNVVGVHDTVWSHQPGAEFASVRIDHQALLERAMARLADREIATGGAEGATEWFRGWTM